RMVGSTDKNGPPESEVIKVGGSDTFQAWSADQPVEAAPGATDVAPFAQRSELAKKIARGQFVVSVEVNPPVGLDLRKSLAAAKMLKAGGVDVVNIRDA